VKRVLNIVAVGEAGTGLALVIVPSLISRLLFGDELAGAGIPMARVAGSALIGLGFALWPGPPLVGMLIYSAVVTLNLVYAGLTESLTGTLLLPAVVLHVVLIVLLGRIWLVGGQLSGEVGGGTR